MFVATAATVTHEFELLAQLGDGRRIDELERLDEVLRARGHTRCYALVDAVAYTQEINSRQTFLVLFNLSLVMLVMKLLAVAECCALCVES